MRIEQFTEGKTPGRNEDALGFNKHTWVVCDGTSPRNSRLYEGKSGGQLAAELAVHEALQVDDNGPALINHITACLAKLIDGELIPAAQTESDEIDIRRLSTTLLCARRIDEQLHVTQVGDTGFRLNADPNQTYLNCKDVDRLNACLRSHYIQLTGDVAGSQDYVRTMIRAQDVYKNNPDHPLGYATLNGTFVPPSLIRTHKFAAADVHTLEIFSDGYFELPDLPTVEAYEEMNRVVTILDPHKWLRYPSTKSADDRTVLIAHFQEPAIA